MTTMTMMMMRSKGKKSKSAWIHSILAVDEQDGHGGIPNQKVGVGAGGKQKNHYCTLFFLLFSFFLILGHMCVCIYMVYSTAFSHHAIIRCKIHIT